MSNGDNVRKNCSYSVPKKHFDIEVNTRDKVNKEDITDEKIKDTTKDFKQNNGIIKIFKEELINELPHKAN